MGVLNAFLAVLSLFLIFVLWTNRVGAPWIPTRMSTAHRMLMMAEVGPDDTVYDLGCGDGRIVVTAARCYGSRPWALRLIPCAIYGARCGSPPWGCAGASELYLAVSSLRT